MNISVSTHSGELYNEEIDHVLIHNQDGELAIYSNHIPIISIITYGYLKLVRGQMEYYVVVSNAVLEFSEERVSVFAGEAYIGTSVSDAKANLESIKNERLSANKKRNVDYTKLEKDLQDNLKNSKAGHL